MIIKYSTISSWYQVPVPTINIKLITWWLKFVSAKRKFTLKSNYHYKIETPFPLQSKARWNFCYQGLSLIIMNDKDISITKGSLNAKYMGDLFGSVG